MSAWGGEGGTLFENKIKYVNKNKGHNILVVR